ncbi:hypothetical protein QTO34_016473 [Cnephaeus nilssonii]|uniref:Uncharacterized protein n=1 Tax=Cnephaeus nilssonii TaxID=3371016 RepID=A0AA40I2C7_CNENI|nr:hypothetical protein QTO34_016473 [Eptesicus nilssonii]
MSATKHDRTQHKRGNHERKTLHYRPITLVNLFSVKSGETLIHPTTLLIYSILSVETEAGASTDPVSDARGRAPEETLTQEENLLKEKSQRLDIHPRKTVPCGTQPAV